MQWRKMALIGVVLLGGSLGLAARQRGLCKRIVGYVRREQSIEECLRHGAVDQATLSLEQAVEGADFVVFCTPISQMEALAAKALNHLSPSALVTDVGSVK